MQTIQLQVKDEFTKNILEVLNGLKGVMIEEIKVSKDPNLEYDPYFYERKRSLDATIKAVDDGSMKMYDFNETIDELITELESSNEYFRD